MEMDKDKIITSLPNGKEKKLTHSLEKVKAIADGKVTLKDINKIKRICKFASRFCKVL